MSGFYKKVVYFILTWAFILFSSWICEETPLFQIALANPSDVIQEMEVVSDLPLIIEVYYASLVSNEHIIILNQKVESLDITNWTLTDGEGTLSFPYNSILPANSHFVVAQNSSLYHRDTLDIADYSYAGGNAIPMNRLSGSFRLNNEGDEIILKDENLKAIDTFVYGGSNYNGSGWDGSPALLLAKGKVARRKIVENRYLDTNSSADWNNLRTYTIGQSNHRLRTFEFEGSARGFLSPDNSLDVVVRTIDSAKSSIYFNAYIFTSISIKQSLISAIRRGVDIKVLIEGGPVGGIESLELEVLQNLSQEGASVRLMMGNASLGIKTRYRYNHAKYLIVDNRTLVISSENWGRTGFPVYGESGNRGWSIKIENNELAGFLTQVFLEDWDPKRVDSINLRDTDIVPVVSENNYILSYGTIFSQEEFSGRFIVTPIIGPDNTLDHDAIIGLIRSAESYIYVEQFYIRKNWGEISNIYLEELIDAARRDIEVRVLLDSSWYNVDENDTLDNDDTIEYLREIAQSENLPLYAKLGNSDSHNLAKFHNKGVVVDGESVLISSINWNYNSVIENRELGLIIVNQELAAFFESAFLYDWKDDVTSPHANAGRDVTVIEGSEVFLSAIGSYDDIEIIRYLWDIGCDGQIELQGLTVSWRFEKPGNYTMCLYVEDFWSNNDTDQITVKVVRSSIVPFEGPLYPLWLPGLILILILALSIAIFMMFRRKAVNTSECL